MGKGREQVALAVVARKPQLARAEVIDKATRARFEGEVEGALKRRPPNEAKLAGALRAIAPYSASVRNAMAEALGIMVRRSAFKRELYTASLRSLADADDKRVAALLRGALGGEDAGSSAALSAACFCTDSSLAPVLTKLAAARQSHLAFGAEIARVARSESNGAHLTSLAPMIKESHRIALCTELLVPLARAKPVPLAISPALKVLRGAERHLGRWLVMAEVAAKSGDGGPAEEAREKSKVGPSSARAAWSLVLWALTEAVQQPSMDGAVPPPETRPTVELIARLSDRPSADRDTTFLFRLARARATLCRPMLEACVKALPLSDEVAIRAALYLARDHGRDDLRQALVDAAHGDGAGPRREELRGLATAALWDLGMADVAVPLAEELSASKSIGNVAWGALTRAASTARARAKAHVLANPSGSDGHVSGVTLTAERPLVHETALRWIQWGWLE
ncbi:hypothetical protein LVJ94_16360 [Pendulispora rubella]|uniref:Uncharacterized protein n=1 Tax=Pendulispora rubella TaxID=2741070 RepID=A0ABZ2LEK6_9BACT